MKKNKLLTLSALALVGACGLVSCGGKTHPKTKPEVYFYANSVTKDIDESGGDTLTETGFKDKECAEVTVENGTDLKYGQEVVIYIEPKDGFTFRDYDTEEWTAIKGAAPVHPYVGLGNPHTLYNYPLPENVAWTFEDLSTPVIGKDEKATGYYNEKYKITVKKEFFKKNIVIDYGNTALNNNVYIYSSIKYKEYFRDGLVNSTKQEQTQENINTYYKMDMDYSSFLAGSEGATITYTFTAGNDLYWLNTDQYWTTEHSSQQDSKGNYLYDNFSVVGIPYDSTNAEPVELAIFDPSKEKGHQAFVPTIINDKISFFINWDKLAEVTPEGLYDPLYKEIKVQLKKYDRELDEEMSEVEPDKRTNITVIPEAAETGNTAPTIIHSGYGQKEYYKTGDNSGYDVLSPISSSTLNTYEPTDTERSTLTFGQCDVLQPLFTGEPAIDTCYGVLFTVKPSSSKNLFDFDISFNLDSGYTFYKVNISTGEPREGVIPLPDIFTDWRRDYYDNETELKYWEIKDGSGRLYWYLVQLNPLYRHNDYLPLKYQANDDDSKFGDLYYLYSYDDVQFIHNPGGGDVYYNTLEITITNHN